jgi:hypothetical protein
MANREVVEFLEGIRDASEEQVTTDTFMIRTILEFRRRSDGERHRRVILATDGRYFGATDPKVRALVDRLHDQSDQQLETMLAIYELRKNRAQLEALIEQHRK